MGSHVPEACTLPEQQEPDHLDQTGQLTGSIGAILVEQGGRALLIDASGACRPQPEEIDAVAVTHLHGDHIGRPAQPSRAAA
jgi:glyoxylase-like metal-dependent hydrolase (beta-lactamase superfamily II)